jgi:hypothetical protein
MAKTSIHIIPCKVGSSEHHNRREKELDYVAKERTHLNERWEEVTNLPGYLSALSHEVKSLTGRAMQSKATPIREGVVVIRASTTMSDLRQLAEKLEAKYKIKTLQIYIHRDEGHNATAEDISAGLAATPGEFICNQHAHMVFDWMNHATGKSIKINRQQMSDMQTMLAETLKMERGVSSGKKHLNALQYKEQAASQHISEQQHAIADLEQKKQTAAAALKNLEEPLAEIVDATQKNIIEPLNFSRWDALQLLIAPAWKNKKIGRKIDILAANYRHAIRVRQNVEKENITLKRQVEAAQKQEEAAQKKVHRLKTILPLIKNMPKVTPRLAEVIANGEKVPILFDSPERGRIYANVCWDAENNIHIRVAKANPEELSEKQQEAQQQQNKKNIPRLPRI